MEQGNAKSGFTILWHVYRNMAKKRGYEFCLTKDEFHKLTKENCWYCNKEPSQIKRDHRCKCYYLYNGIDRVDNNQGYAWRNCVPCCGTCNSMKRTLSEEAFISHIRRIMRVWG